MTQTASFLEIPATVINILGIATTGYMLYGTVRRLRAVQAQPERFPTGREILAAWRHIRCEMSRILYHVLSFGIGIWAMMLPDEGSSYETVSMMIRLTVAGVFTACSILDLLKDGHLRSLLLNQSSSRRPR